MTTKISKASFCADPRLARYFRSIQRFPLLTAETEKQLAIRHAETGDVAASHQLVNSHLRLAAKIAMGYRGYGLPVEDLIAQGNLGLLQAVERFDPHRGFRLSTYATWWIRAAIQEYIVQSRSLVKMGTTTEQKKLFFNLARLKAQIQALEEGDLEPENARKIADLLKVPEAEVVSMNRRLAGFDASLNVAVRDGGDAEWQDWLVDEGDDQEHLFADREEADRRRRLLAGALEHLSGREREIVTERHLKERPLTLEELSRRFGVSRERVRQIEVGALAKLKRIVDRNRPSRPASSDNGFAPGARKEACAA